MKRKFTVSGRCMGGALAVFLAGAFSNVAESEPQAQLFPEASAESAGFSEQGLAALDERLAGYVEAGQVAGIEAMLVKDGELVYSSAHGLRDVEEQVPLGEGTIYRIYSMTKPITGVALMQLYEQGKFHLSDPITTYIPEFENLMVLDGTNEDGSPKLVEMKGSPTMRDLMSHTAGFAYGLGGQDYANEQFREKQVLRSPDMQTMIDKVAGIPLLFQPGERWSYSVAVDIQGYLVEQFSGMSLGDYLESNVFAPLNMDDTGFYVAEADYDRLADIMYYSDEAGRFIPIDSETVQFRKDTVPFESGGGGLVSTIDDYARFCQMMLNKGTLNGHRILRPESVDLMTLDQLPSGMGIGFDGTKRAPEEGEPHKFGLNFGLITDPEAMNSPAGTGTYYWGGAAGTWFWIDPENDLFFIGMIQRFGADPEVSFEPRAESMRLVYEALQP